MIKGVILASYSFFGNGAIGEMLARWEEAGFFAYILPFLLIFALIFGILNRIQIFKDNKGINGIIALVVGLMALQFEMVPQFFAEIFPRLGVGLAILLILLICAGLFIDPSKGAMIWTLLGIGIVIAIIIFVNTAGALGWPAGQWWYDNWETVAGVVFILIIVGVIVGSSSSTPGTPSQLNPWWTR